MSCPTCNKCDGTVGNIGGAPLQCLSHGCDGDGIDWHERELVCLRESVRRLVGEWRSKAIKLTDLQNRNEDNTLGPAAMGSAAAIEACANELEAFLAENKDLTPPQTEGRGS